MTGDDRTIIRQPASGPGSAGPIVEVQFADPRGRPITRRFDCTFRIGRAAGCDVQIAEERVSREHCEIQYVDRQWWLRDLGSANGSFVDGRPVARVQLKGECRLQCGEAGVEITLREIAPAREAGEAPAQARQPPAAASVTQFMAHYLGKQEDADAGEHTMMVRQAFRRVESRQRRRYGWVIAAVVVALLGTLGVAGYQYYRLQQIRSLATSIFYDMKDLQLQLVNSYKQAGVSPSQASKARLESMRAKYDSLVRESGLLDEDMSAEDKLIYRMARVFGECELNMPADFVTTVKDYIARWQSTGRLPQAMARLHAHDGLARFIYTQLVNRYLPPQLLYLALQESDFRDKAIGPETRYGIAKGMWQFIPSTATQYGLATGPLVELPRYDPRDERFDPRQASVAAAKYLSDIYSSEAQASGLLVMAGYNWGHNRVRRLIKSMPANPRERNFWQLLARFDVPQETRDYVFYIFAAAVIGENPALFGFDFNNPLEMAEESSSLSGLGDRGEASVRSKAFFRSF
ncbi:MAG: transglycosylase SLT domain-containing protein, partial [Salinisphaera sp.]|nr:transglycosylase SLT domain-containing protein [Salinisphaera sp.]